MALRRVYTSTNAQSLIDSLIGTSQPSEQPTEPQTHSPGSTVRTDEWLVAAAPVLPSLFVSDVNEVRTVGDRTCVLVFISTEYRAAQRRYLQCGRSSEVNRRSDSRSEERTG